MASRKPKIEIIKLETPRPASRPKKFPTQPILYLELLENKDKIKQELVNKEYVPPSLPVLNPNIILEEPEEVEPQEKEREERYDSSPPPSDSESEVEKRKSVSSSDEESESSRKRSRYSSSENESDSSYRKRNKGHKLSKSSSPSSSDESSSEDDDELSNRIKQLLKKDKSRSPKKNDSSSDSSAKSTPKKKFDMKKVIPVAMATNAPSLKELEMSGQYQPKKVIPDLTNQVISNQDKDDMKRELLFKFELLKKSYNNVSIPEFTIHSDYDHMLKTYEMTLKKVSVDSSVDSYKTYLIGGFMLVEFVLSNWFNLDMQGFSQQQIVNMNNYERLLIELGEKSYVPTASKLPVEIRLIIMIIIQAGLFVVTKMLMKKTGANLLNMINTMNVPKASPSGDSGKRKMRGPDIPFDNIPDSS